ncbi:hypothetical protein [Devosia sp.]|uniref:hypothetical protein n=1 Tax=Devosia sp. TaxID=1871048 RepID=UPI002FC58C6A
MIATAAVAAVVLLVGGAFGVQYLISPKSYDECMLSEMRGQDQAMFSTARITCERRHAVEVAIPITSDDWRWTNDRLYALVTLSDQILTGYTPTRAQFAFSTETCAETDVNAMEKHIPSIAKNGGFQLGIMAPSDPKCLHMLELWGTRK